MNPTQPANAPAQQAVDPFLSAKQAVPLALVAVASFHFAYNYSSLSFLIVVFLFCLFRLAHLRTGRQALYLGMGIGLLIYAPQLSFFWTLFKAGAFALWFVLAFWLGLFLVLGRACLVRFGPFGLAIAAPFLWTGLEFYRGELYFLRFSWLSAGYAFSNAEELRYMAVYGVYGTGFLIMASASLFYIMASLKKKTRFVAIAFLGSALIYPVLQQLKTPALTGKTVHIAGVQMEAPNDIQVKLALNQLVKKYPQAELLVLSEYTFQGPVPDLIKTWCRDNQKYLIAGGKDPVPPADFYNTAFVVDPSGEIVFRQGKSIPIQFFKDGLPAREQKLWNSPWGMLGLAICYDSSYTRVMDGLIRLGAQALIVPTMDVADWGERQHLLHSRIIPMRAAEYQLPIFRLCSSGISQFATPNGSVKASAPFPGDMAMMEATMELPARGRLPLDRWLAPASVGVTAALVSWFIANAIARWRRARGKKAGKS